MFVTITSGCPNFWMFSLKMLARLRIGSLANSKLPSGNTERAAEVIARAAAQAGVRNIVMHDVSRSDHSYILSDIFKYDTIVLGAPTYNNGIYPQMQALIDEIAERGIKNHRLAVFGSFTWAGQTVKKILEANETRLKFELVGTPVEIKQSLNAETEAACETLGRALA